jgi:hypothetical protein
MDCPKVEERLSEYMERSLSFESMAQVSEHLLTCPRCSALLNEMQSVVSLCRRLPDLEMDPDLVDRILIRTLGRPRRRSFFERLRINLVQPFFTPRYAVGAGLATLFLALMINLMGPRMPAAPSAVSPSSVFSLLDRGVQRLYSGGLKAYDKTSQWQAQFSSFKRSTFNRMRFMIEWIEVPMEGRKKSEKPEQREEQSPQEKRSGLMEMSACNARIRS